MYEPLITRLGIVTIFGSCKPRQTIFKQINFQWIITRDHTVDSQVVFVAIDQVRLTHVLRNDITRLTFHLSPSTNDLNSLTA